MEQKKNKDFDMISDSQVKQKIKEYTEDSNVIGIMLWGSRATGFGAPESSITIFKICL